MTIYLLLNYSIKKSLKQDYLGKSIFYLSRVVKIKSQQERGDTPVGFLQYIVILYVINSNHILFLLVNIKQLIFKT